MLRRGILALAFFVLSGAVYAQGEAEEEEGPWSGTASVGYLSTSGNTETTSYNTKVGVVYTVNDWEHGLNLSGNGAEDTGETTAEAYQAGWRSAYQFAEHNFIFGTVDWRKDRFAGVVEQMSYALNYGRRVINTPNHILGLGLGAGYRDSDRADGTSEGNAIARGSLDYNWIFSETSGFDQNIIVESGSDNTFIESVSAVRANLLGELALVVSYTIRHNTDVPVGTEETDTISAISLEYAF